MMAPNSALPMVFVIDAHSIWFDKAGGRGARVVCPCTYRLFFLINLTVAIHFSPFLPVRHFLAECGLECVGKNNACMGLKGCMCRYSRGSFKS